MAIAIRQIHKHFVGEVSGVDLRQPLTKDEAAAIEAGMDKYAVLVFHGQDITDDQQMAFALNFGQRENPRGGNITKKEDYRLGSAGLNDVSNLGKDGKPLAKDHRTHLFNLGRHLGPGINDGQFLPFSKMPRQWRRFLRCFIIAAPSDSFSEPEINPTQLNSIQVFERLPEETKLALSHCVVSCPANGQQSQ